MKLCFPVQQNNGIDSDIFPHFGPAPMFLICDTDTLEVSEITNQSPEHKSGGCNPMAKLGGGKFDSLIVGGIGGGAIVKLKQAGISVYMAVQGSIKDNVEKFNAGTLTQLGEDHSCSEHDEGGSGCAH